MLDILAITCPIAIGFLSTRKGLSALAQLNLGEILNLGDVLAYLSGTLLLVVLGLFWCQRVAGLGPSSSAIYVMGMSCSNSGFVGCPILAQPHGQENVSAAALLVTAWVKAASSCRIVCLKAH